MGIDSRVENDVTILDVTGNLTIGEADVQLRQAVADALDAGAKKLLLNLSGVKRMDSSGVGELLGAHTSAARHGCRIKVASLSPRVASVLQVTKLLGVMDSHDSVDEALTAFSPS